MALTPNDTLVRACYHFVKLVSNSYNTPKHQLSHSGRRSGDVVCNRYATVVGIVTCIRLLITSGQQPLTSGDDA